MTLRLFSQSKDDEISNDSRDSRQVRNSERAVGENESEDDVPDEVVIPPLTYLEIRKIIKFTIRKSPIMRFTLQRVCPEFAEIVEMMGYPRVYLHPIPGIELPRIVSCSRLNRLYGGYSGLMLEIRKVLSEVGGRWYSAWLTLRDLGYGWHLIVDVTWRR